MLTFIWQLILIVIEQMSQEENRYLWYAFHIIDILDSIFSSGVYIYKMKVQN